VKALRAFQGVLGSILLALSLPVEAQQSSKISRIGLLFATSPSAAVGRIQAFQQGLYERGHVEGKTILLEYRYADGKLERIPALARELVGLKSDVIVTNGPTDTRAVKDTTNTIPIVMAQDSDPVGSGFVASLARPGGNITGLSTLSPEISGKQVDLLKEIDLTLSRIMVVGNSAEPGNAKTLEEMRLAATAVGVQLQYLDLRRHEDIESVLANIKRGRAGALIVLRNPIASTSRKRIIEFAAKNRLLAMYVSSDWVEAGGLVSYALDVRDNYRRAAIYVDKILKGAKPADLPVEQPTKFELVINLKTTKQIGLTIPPNVLARADRVIR
jgi:putative tryptophan/tyrosine transport system substrate-binding protein